MISIEVISNGYILTYKHTREVYKEEEIEKLYNRILQIMTGKASSFGGEFFGEVRINFDKNKRLKFDNEE